MNAVTDPDAALTATHAAAEAVRTANHAAYDAPRDPVALHERTGALHDLLVKTHQLTEVLGEAAAELSRNPQLAAGPGNPARGNARVASLHLADAAVQLDAAMHAIDLAWSLLSGLRLDEP